MTARRSKLFVAIAFLGTFACFGAAACGDEDPEAGTSCFADDECGSMSCHCVEGEGEIPGVCSTECEVDEDCAVHGEDFSCSLDFCTGVNVCLRLTN